VGLRLIASARSSNSTNVETLSCLRKRYSTIRHVLVHIQPELRRFGRTQLSARGKMMHSASGDGHASAERPFKLRSALAYYLLPISLAGLVGSVRLFAPSGVSRD